MQRFVLLLSFLSLATVLGCSSPSTTADDAGTDTGRSADGAVDTGVDGAVDGGGVDAGGSDAGDVDAGGSDAGDVDAGDVDAGGSDAGGSDAGGSDAGGSDAGTDAGHDAGTDAGSDAGTDTGVLTINGCTAATAEDHTSMTTVSIAFGGATGLAYAPRCIRVRAGTTVTFNGTFSFHPLQAGTVSGAIATPAAAGTTPLPTTAVNTGTTASFVMSPTGAYGYYCSLHGTFGMNGAIFVE